MESIWGIELRHPSPLFSVIQVSIYKYSKRDEILFKGKLPDDPLRYLNNVFNSLPLNTKIKIIDELCDSIIELYTYNLASRQIDL